MAAQLELPEVEAAALLEQQDDRLVREGCHRTRVLSVAGGLVASALVGVAVLTASAQPSSPATAEEQPSSDAVGLFVVAHDEDDGKATKLIVADDDEDDDNVNNLIVVDEQQQHKQKLLLHAGDKRPSREHELRDEEKGACSWDTQNCTATKCCNNPGHQCYYQSETTNYAQCRESCVPDVPDPSHWDGEWWSCQELGKRSKGNRTCSNLGEDCRQSHCCSQPNTQCYEKNDGWATCKVSCVADAPDLSDSDGNLWTCKELGPRSPTPAWWLESQCAGLNEDCRFSKCCSSPGAQCYKQNDDWASCRYDCTAGKDPERDWEPEWSCEEIGLRTPGTGPEQSSIVSSWAKDQCAWDGNDCSQSRCCRGMNKQCYEKNENWAICLEACTPGNNTFDNNEYWSCKELGVRSMGLALRGSPSVFCWSLFMTTSYEADIIRFQMNANYGIFQCDEYALLSTDEAQTFGQDVEGKDVKTIQVQWAEITTSVDGTAGNAQLFVNCWNAVVQDGRWNNHAWTIKVDPDAVVIPDRLRQHLSSHNMENVYVVNCNKFPSSPNFPMMYGSLEIYSWKAIQTYANNMIQCMNDMAAMLPLWGEDYFMTHCLDHIGVGRIADFASIGDNVCTGANCGDGWVAAFHPFKDVESWKNCWDTAHR